MSVKKTKANGITLHYSEQPQTVIFLKVCKYEISRSSRGRAFHNLGGATWKDLSPSVTLVLNVDDAKKIPPDDLKLYAPCDFKETKF